MISEHALRGKHRGQIGFVLGAGPSLRHIEPETLKPYVTLAVNSAISKFRNANYFLAQDTSVTQWDYYRDIPGGCICLLNRTRLSRYCSHIEPANLCLYDRKLERTGAGTAVRFLELMGCSPIVLLGCDCSNENGKHYFWQFEGEKTCTRKNSEKVSEHLHDNGDFVRYWEEQFKGANIINASGGEITAFPTMTLTEVLARYG